MEFNISANETKLDMDRHDTYNTVGIVIAILGLCILYFICTRRTREEEQRRIDFGVARANGRIALRNELAQMQIKDRHEFSVTRAQGRIDLRNELAESQV